LHTLVKIVDGRDRIGGKEVPEVGFDTVERDAGFLGEFAAGRIGEGFGRVTRDTASRSAAELPYVSRYSWSPKSATTRSFPPRART